MLRYTTHHRLHAVLPYLFTGFALFLLPILHTHTAYCCTACHRLPLSHLPHAFSLGSPGPAVTCLLLPLPGLLPLGSPLLLRTATHRLSFLPHPLTPHWFAYYAYTALPLLFCLPFTSTTCGYTAHRRTAYPHLASYLRARHRCALCLTTPLLRCACLRSSCLPTCSRREYTYRVDYDLLRFPYVTTPCPGLPHTTYIPTPDYTGGTPLHTTTAHHIHTPHPTTYLPPCRCRSYTTPSTPPSPTVDVTYVVVTLRCAAVRSPIRVTTHRFTVPHRAIPVYTRSHLVDLLHTYTVLLPCTTYGI